MKGRKGEEIPAVRRIQRLWCELAGGGTGGVGGEAVYARYEVALGKMLDSKRISGQHLRPYLRNQDVQWDNVSVDELPQMDFSEAERPRFRLAVGDLLVCEGGEVGRTGVWRGELNECYYQKAVHRLRPLRRAQDLSRFLYYVMYAAAEAGIFSAGSNSNTIDHLTAVKLRHHRFPFPPYNSQRAIADFLDRETARIDALTDKIREAIKLLTEYRTTLISAAVTGKIDVRQEIAA